MADEKTVDTADVLDLIGSIDGGTLYAILQDDLDEIVQALRKRKAEGVAAPKAKMTITLAFKFDGKMVDITPDVTTKLPRPVNGRGVFWVTNDNKLSPQDPQQLELGVVRDVATDRPRVLHAS